ncbi:MAG: DUF268 domain-containing protein [Roseburia sp.]|jgi:hypothetical protein|nr:DUF268 domain-containing protein [Roseburia sp.]
MKIWVWGTGEIAERVMKDGLGREIEGFIETEKSKDSFCGYPVISAKEIPQEFDFILVANRFGDQIHEWCVAAGFEMQKILFLVRGRWTEHVEIPPGLRAFLGEKIFTGYQAEYGLTGHTFFEEDRERYQKLNQRENFEIREEDLWPVMIDRFAENGTMGNYFWQDLWAAKLVIQSGVREHYDIGSRVDGFLAHLLSAGILVNAIDIRPLPVEVEGLSMVIDDATLLEHIEDGSIESLSALCSLEHFGLGRYGDPVDPEACFKCFSQIKKKLAPGGKLYLAVPVGRERVEFNAHRVFFASTIIESFAGLRLVEFSCAAEGKIEYHVDLHKYDHDPHNGEFRYGLFCFEKPQML